MQVKHAADYGAIGAILFSDPNDVAEEGQDAENVYPFNTWLPGNTGNQATQEA